jgi:O-antigen/teichoic acid export membrane protein
LSARKRLVFKSAASVIDQVLLSGLNFLIGLALIRFATKETYGLYSQLFAGGLLVTTLLDALIGTALTTLSSRLSEEEGKKLVARAARLHWAANALLAAAGGGTVWVMSGSFAEGESPAVLALSFAAFLLALGGREYCRTALFIELKSEQVVRLDFTFVMLTIVGAVAFFWLDSVSVTMIFSLLALSNGVAAVLFSGDLWRGAGTNTPWVAYAGDIRTLWAMSRWALIGSLLGWLGNNSYLYFTSGMVGVAALADMNAARLLLIPITIAGMAWSRMAQPAMGREIAARSWESLHRYVVRSFIAIEGFTVLYVAALMMAFPLLSEYVFGEKYRHVAQLVFLWGCYFGINAARNVGTVLLTSFGEFQILFWQGAISLAVLVSLWWFLIPRFGVVGVLGAMIIVEILELVVNHAYLIPRAKRLQLLAA